MSCRTGRRKPGRGDGLDRWFGGLLGSFVVFLLCPLFFFNLTSSSHRILGSEGKRFWNKRFCPVSGLLFNYKQKPKYFIISK
jgi:hypothetical protein